MNGAQGNTSKLRFLCLHGWRTNKKILSQQTQGLQTALQSLKESLRRSQPSHSLNDTSIEFVNLNGFFQATGAPTEDVIATFGTNETYFQWWDAIERVEDSNTTCNDKVYDYVGAEESMAFIDKFIDQHGPFDAVLGFSQGAILTTMMNAKLQHEQRPKPWKVAVLVCGMPPRDLTWSKVLKDVVPLDIPSIHLMGEKDYMYEKSQSLLQCYREQDRSKWVHAGGHKFPTSSKYPSMYFDIARTLLQHCGHDLRGIQLHSPLPSTTLNSEDSDM